MAINGFCRASLPIRQYNGVVMMGEKIPKDWNHGSYIPQKTIYEDCCDTNKLKIIRFHMHFLSYVANGNFFSGKTYVTNASNKIAINGFCKTSLPIRLYDGLVTMGEKMPKNWNHGMSRAQKTIYGGIASTNLSEQRRHYFGKNDNNTISGFINTKEDLEKFKKQS